VVCLYRRVATGKPTPTSRHRCTPLADWRPLCHL